MQEIIIPLYEKTKMFSLYLTFFWYSVFFISFRFLSLSFLHPWTSSASDIMNAAQGLPENFVVTINYTFIFSLSLIYDIFLHGLRYVVFLFIIAYSQLGWFKMPGSIFCPGLPLMSPGWLLRTVNQTRSFLSPIPKFKLARKARFVEVLINSYPFDKFSHLNFGFQQLLHK